MAKPPSYRQMKAAIGAHKEGRSLSQGQQRIISSAQGAARRAGPSFKDLESKGDKHSNLAEKALANDDPHEAHRHLAMAREHYRAEGQHAAAATADAKRVKVGRDAGIEVRSMASHIIEARRDAGTAPLASNPSKFSTPESESAVARLRRGSLAKDTQTHQEQAARHDKRSQLHNQLISEKHDSSERRQHYDARDAHAEAAFAHRAAYTAQLSGDKQRYEAAKEKAVAASDKARAIETGPRGGQFTRTASGGKRYGKRGGGGAVASMRSKIPEDTE